MYCAMRSLNSLMCIARNSYEPGEEMRFDIWRVMETLSLRQWTVAMLASSIGRLTR